METGSGADIADCGGVAVGDAASSGSGVAAGNAVSGSGVAGLGPGDTTNGGVGGDAASFVPKTNSSIALPNGLRFLVLISALP